MGCHRSIPRWHKPYLKTKICMDVSLTTEVMAISLFIWPILAIIWLPWQRSLDHCNQKCLLWMGWPRKPPAISSCIHFIFCRNAFMCIYSNFSPKIGCCGKPLRPLIVYGSVTDEFPDGINRISKPNSAWMRRLKQKLWPFLAYFGQTSAALATSLRPLQSEMSYLDLSTPKTIP